MDFALKEPFEPSGNDLILTSCALSIENTAGLSVRFSDFPKVVVSVFNTIMVNVNQEKWYIEVVTALFLLTKYFTNRYS